MNFKLLTEEKILQLTEEDLHNYLNELKVYQTKINTTLKDKKEILNKLINQGLTQDKSKMSHRNKVLLKKTKKHTLVLITIKNDKSDKYNR